MIQRILCSAALALATAAGASPVLDRSSYSVYLEGEGSPELSNFQVSFDGRKEWFVRSGRDISVEESATDLGGGRWQVDVHLWTNVPLFAMPGEGGWAGLGFLGDGFDLGGDYRLEAFTLSYTDPTGQSFNTLNLAEVFRPFFADPWDGRTPRTVMAPLGDQYNELNLRFVLAAVTSVPEPGGLALATLALAGLGCSRRRRVGAIGEGAAHRLLRT